MAPGAASATAAPEVGAVSRCHFSASSRPIGHYGSGIATVFGWSTPAGGYGQGTIEYASLAMVQGQVTDADIYAAVADVLPVAAIGWTSIAN